MMEQSQSQLEKLHTDKIFLEYLVYFQNQALKLNNVNVLNSYIEDGMLSNFEQKNIHKLFGYDNSTTYWDEFSKQNERVNYLVRRYNIKNVSEKRLKEEITLVFNNSSFYSHLNLPIDSLIMPRMADYSDPICETMRRNCIISVAAEATIMHLSCAALNITVFMGAICHAAAITYQFTAGNRCNQEAKKSETDAH